MNVENVNRWLTLAANLGVIVGIVFLALEVNQNTQMTLIDREDRQQEQSNGRFIDSDSLAEIEAKISAVVGITETETRLMKDYGLTLAEAKLWRKYMLNQWLAGASNFEVTGSDIPCAVGASLTRVNDNHILFEELGLLLNDQYRQCVNSMNARIDEAMRTGEFPP